MRLQALFVAALAASAPAIGNAGEAPITFTKLWTHTHATPGHLSEIPAYDARTHTIWVAGVVGVDVLDAATGALIKHIAVPACGAAVVAPCGSVNSLAIHNGLAAFAIESSDRTAPGSVAFYDTRTRVQTGHVAVGALPDMLAFTHDGSRLLVANEATPYVYGSRIGTSVPWVFAAPAADPAGSVSIIDVETRSVIATPGFAGVPTYGSHLRTNTGMDFEPEYIAIASDGTRAFVTLQEANAIAVLDLASNAFTAVIGLGAKDFSLPGNQIDPLDNDGKVEFISPTAKGLYMPDGIAGRTYAFVGLERTTKSAVAVFDVTNPHDVGFVDMIVGEGDISPEGIAVFRHRGDDYLAVAHEVSNTTTLHRIDRARRPAHRYLPLIP